MISTPQATKTPSKGCQISTWEQRMKDPSPPSRTKCVKIHPCHRLTHKRESTVESSMRGNTAKVPEVISPVAYNFLSSGDATDGIINFRIRESLLRVKKWEIPLNGTHNSRHTCIHCRSQHCTEYRLKSSPRKPKNVFSSSNTNTEQVAAATGTVEY